MRNIYLTLTWKQAQLLLSLIDTIEECDQDDLLIFELIRCKLLEEIERWSPLYHFATWCYWYYHSTLRAKVQARNPLADVCFSLEGTSQAVFFIRGFRPELWQLAPRPWLPGTFWGGHYDTPPSDH